MQESEFSSVGRSRGQVDTAFVHNFCSISLTMGVPNRQRLEQQKHFLLADSNSYFIIIYQGQRPVAKAAIFVSALNQDIAFLGCYEVDHSEHRQHISKLALEQAKSWACTQSVKKIYGPIDRNSWYQNRVRTDLDTRAFSWEPARAPTLLEDWQAFGFKFDRRYASYAFKGHFWFNMMHAALAFAPAHLLAKLKGFRVQPMSPQWADNLPDLYKLAMRSFTKAHLFEPIQFDEFTLLYGKLGAAYDLSPSMFLLDSKGTRIGFILAFYQQDYLVVKTLGIDAEWQGSGLARSLICVAWYKAAQAGYKLGIAALIRAGNSSEYSIKFLQKCGVLHWVHEYELLVYEIEGKT